MTKINVDRLIADLRALGEIGRDPDGGITRRALSIEDAKARRLVADRLRALGLEVRHDVVGNLRAKRRGRRNLPSVMTGSHLDSVPSGGWLDGPLGVVGAVAAIEALGEVETERPIEVAIFVGEEGSRFPRGTIGSAAMSGHVAVQKILELRDADGVSYAEALRTYEDDGEPLACPATDIDSYVELHIEQGGVLESENLPIGAVTAIAGLVQERWSFGGDANHAGATPMNLRKDALTAAARWVLHVEASAKKVGAVGTVGQLAVEPGGKNIIPGRVTAICDLRAPSREMLDALADEVRQFAAPHEIAVERSGLQRVEPGPMHERVIAAVEIAAQKAGLQSRRMLSGAIHDALHMAEICPSSMIFVPSIGGKSHCPTEDTDPTHLAQGCEVLARTLLELAQ